MNQEEHDQMGELALAALHRAQEVAHKRSAKHGTPFIVAEPTRAAYQDSQPLQPSVIREASDTHSNDDA